MLEVSHFACWRIVHFMPSPSSSSETARRAGSIAIGSRRAAAPGLAEVVVWQELFTRELLVCARRAEPSLPEPVLDGTATVGVAGDDWVNHLLLGDWAHKGL